MRTYRLDYPDKAKDPFKKAIVVKLEDGEIKFIRRKMLELRPEFRPK